MISKFKSGLSKSVKSSICQVRCSGLCVYETDPSKYFLVESSTSSTSVEVTLTPFLPDRLMDVWHNFAMHFVMEDYDNDMNKKNSITCGVVRTLHLMNLI